MQHPPQITFRHMDVSPAAEARILEEVAALEHCYDRITSCHVVVEAPHHHHQRDPSFQVSIGLNVPGSQIVVKHEPSSQPEHRDLYVAIRDTFAAARRQLQDHARVLRGDVKHHLQKASVG